GGRCSAFGRLFQFLPLGGGGSHLDVVWLAVDQQVPARLIGRGRKLHLRPAYRKARYFVAWGEESPGGWRTRYAPRSYRQPSAAERSLKMRVQEMFDSISQQLAQMVVHVQEVRQSNIRLGERLEALERRFDSLEQRINSLRSE